MKANADNNLLNLIEVLEELSQTINLGCELAKRKTEILQTNDLEALKLATKETETIASRIAELENQRLALQAEAGESATIKSLCESIEGDFKKRAEKVVRELTRCARQLEIQNSVNQEIMEHLLNYTRFNLSKIVQACPTPTYGQAGTDQNTISRSALDRKA